MIADARSTMASLLQNYMKDVDKTLTKHTETHKAKAEVAVHGERFGKNLKQLINALFKEAQKERDNAQKMMKDVSGDIQKESREDDEEHKEYTKYMDEMGENEKEYHADDDEDDDDNEHEHKEGGEDDHEDHHDKDDPATVKKQLDHFFQKAAEAKMLNLQEHTVGEWQKFWETEVTPKMESDDADASAAAKTEFEKKMVEMITAAGMKPFHKETHGEVSDYFQDLLDAGKAMRHKAELDALTAAFKDGSKDHMTLVAEIEKLAEEKDVPLHWLWEDEKDPTFDQDEEYEKDSDEYEHEHEHDDTHDEAHHAAEHHEEAHSEAHDAAAGGAGSAAPPTS